MLDRIRNQIGTAGLVVAIVALVAALGGGAYAASSSATHKKSSAGKRGPRGPRGFAGPAGPAGPAGAKGDTGAKGDQGDQGIQGIQGIQGLAGTNGKSVLDCTGGPTDALGQNGDFCIDTDFEQIYGPKAAGTWTGTGPTDLKGTNGTNGTDSPFAGGHLATGTTETGLWTSPIPSKTFTTPQSAAVSFPIPLAASLDCPFPGLGDPACHVHYQDDANFADFDGVGGSPDGCAGSAADPTAPSGHLCIYKGTVVGATVSVVLPFSTTGGTIGITNTGAGFANVANGSWAVTG